MTETPEWPAKTGPPTPPPTAAGPVAYPTAPGPTGPYSAGPHPTGPYPTGPQPTGPDPTAPHPYAYPPGPYPGSYPPPPMPYGGYPYGDGQYSDYTVPQAPRNGVGIMALVTAIIGLVSSFSVAGGILLGLAAVILGFIGRGRVKRGEADNGGVALAGIVLGVISIVAGLIFVAIWVGLFKQVGAGDYFDCLQKAGQDPAKVQLCSDEFRQTVEDRFNETRQPVR